MKERLIKGIMVLSFSGVLFSIWLIYKNFRIEGFCPKFFFIPACYIVLAAFLMVFISNFITKKIINILMFVTGTLLGLSLAVWFSYNQFYGFKNCPTLFTFPLCYASFIIFILLIIMKISEIMLKK